MGKKDDSGSSHNPYLSLARARVIKRKAEVDRKVRKAEIAKMEADAALKIGQTRLLAKTEKGQDPHPAEESNSTASGSELVSQRIDELRIREAEAKALAAETDAQTARINQLCTLIAFYEKEQMRDDYDAALAALKSLIGTNVSLDAESDNS